MRAQLVPSRSDGLAPQVAAPGRPGAPFAALAELPYEVAAFAYLDPEWRVLGMRHRSSGLRDEVAITLRDVVADVLAFDAAAVVMAHNHPSGDASPSPADYAVTRRIARTLSAIGVRLVDHLVFVPGGCHSFRERGLL